MTTIKEIYEDVNDEVTTDLSIGASSSSKSAEFRLWIYITAKISLLLQGLWDVFKRELETAADNVPTCNASWWVREVQKFQYGYTLELNNITKKYLYATEDLGAQIVTNVAVIGNRIKVAKDGNVALTTDEKAALISYKNKILPVGSNIIIVSQDADVIKVDIDVHYDPIIPITTVRTNVELAINGYLSTLNFNVGQSGTFYTTFMIDAIQLVEGVVDVTVNEMSSAQDGGVLVSFPRKYIPVAGHIQVDPSNSLTSTITYLTES